MSEEKFLSPKTCVDAERFSLDVCEIFLLLFAHIPSGLRPYGSRFLNVTWSLPMSMVRNAKEELFLCSNLLFYLSQNHLLIRYDRVFVDEFFSLKGVQEKNVRTFFLFFFFLSFFLSFSVFLLIPLSSSFFLFLFSGLFKEKKENRKEKQKEKIKREGKKSTIPPIVSFLF